MQGGKVGQRRDILTFILTHEQFHLRPSVQRADCHRKGSICRETPAIGSSPPLAPRIKLENDIVGLRSDEITTEDEAIDNLSELAALDNKRSVPAPPRVKRELGGSAPPLNANPDSEPDPTLDEVLNTDDNRLLQLRNEMSALRTAHKLELDAVRNVFTSELQHHKRLWRHQKGLTDTARRRLAEEKTRGGALTAELQEVQDELASLRAKLFKLAGGTRSHNGICIDTR